MSASEPGSRLLEEIVLLTQAVAERVGPWLDRVAAAKPARPESAGAEPEGSPLAALTALLRGEPNEQAARSLDRAADLVALLRAVLADRWEPGVIHMPGFRPADRASEAGEQAGHASDAGQTGGAGVPRVQHIPVRRGFRSSARDT